MTLSEIKLGHVLEVLPTLPAGSVQTIVTSPPYYALRDYGLPPTIWGGDAACAHVWGEWQEMHDTREPETVAGKTRTTDRSFGGDESRRFDGNHQKHTAGAFCQRCSAWQGCLGLEPSVSLYISHMLLVFNQLWRVLRDDGTVWLNMGDSFASSSGPVQKMPDIDIYRRTTSGKLMPPQGRAPGGAGVKRKDLLGVPWLLAFALRDAGWYLRSDIVWGKSNAMPESVEDRPTRSHEFVFLLSKSERYYYDQEAIREPMAAIRKRGPHEYRGQAEIRPRGNYERALSQPTGRRKLAVPTGWDTSIGAGGHTKLMGRYPHPADGAETPAPPQDTETAERDLSLGGGATREDDVPEVWPQGKGNARTFRGGGAYTNGQSFDNSTPVERASHGNVPNETGMRNKRDVWWVATRPFAAAHFAVMPEQLVEPCIQAGTSARGACPQCGAPWKRLVERTRTIDGEPAPELGTWRADTISTPNTAQGVAHARIATLSRTVGWEPTCRCPAEDPVPCVVLDPFCGSGTVLRVAARLGRASVGVDLKSDYVTMATTRTTGVQMAMPLWADEAGE